MEVTHDPVITRIDPVPQIFETLPTAAANLDKAQYRYAGGENDHHFVRLPMSTGDFWAVSRYKLGECEICKIIKPRRRPEP